MNIAMWNKIEVKRSVIKNAGRGVFATADIKKGEVIEICPVLIFNKKDTDNILITHLGDYVYAYEGSRSLFAMGYGSLYNHSNTPNAKYELMEHEGQPEQGNELCITSLKHIDKGEEIYINYGKDHFAV